MEDMWFLRGGDIFAGLELEKQLFLANSRKYVLQKNEMVFYEGDPGNCCFYLESGLVRIFSIHDSGKEPIFFLRRPGEIFGISEVLDCYPRKASAQAMTPTTLHRMEGTVFNELLQNNYPLAKRIISLLGGRIRYLGDTIRSLMACNVEDRWAKLLIALAYELFSKPESWHNPVTVPVRISQEQLAQLAGTTQPTVSELLKKMQLTGKIRIEKRRITILEPLALLAAIEDACEHD